MTTGMEEEMGWDDDRDGGRDGMSGRQGWRKRWDGMTTGMAEEMGRDDGWDGGRDGMG